MLRAKLSHLEILNPNRFNPVLNITARGLTTAGIAQSNGVKDISGNGNNGTAFNGVEVVNDSEMGECFSFSAMNRTYIDVTSSNLLTILDSAKAYTLLFNAKCSNRFYSTLGGLIRFGTTSCGAITTLCKNSKPVLNFGDTLSSVGSKSFTYNYSTFKLIEDKICQYVVVVDYENGILKFALNGEIKAVDTEWLKTETFENIKTLTKIRIGATNPSGSEQYCFAGLISEVKIFPYALNSNEVKELYRMSQNPSGIVPSTELMSTEALDYDSKYWEPRITDSVDIERFFDINSDTANRIRTLQIGLDNSDRRFDRYMADGRSLLNNIMTLYYDTEKTAMAPKGEILHLSAVGLTTEGIKQENGIPDLSGNGNNGRAYNTVSVVQDDDLGECFDFNGGCIEGNLNYSKTFTLSFNFKENTSTPNAYSPFFTVDGKEYGYLTIYHNSDSKRGIAFQLYDYKDRILMTIFSAAKPDINSGWHITVTVDWENKVLKYYKNGILIISRAIETQYSTRLPDSFTSYRIGTLNNRTSYPNVVKMNDIYIYPRALTDEEVHDLYLSSIPDNNPVKRSFTGSIQSIDSYGSEVRLTLRELGYEYLEQNYPDAQIAYDYYSDSGINESWNCIPIHFGTVKGIPLSWVNSFYSEYMIGSGPILRVTRIYIDTDRSLPETDTSEVDGKDNGVLYKLVNNVGTETGYKPSSSDPDREVIHVRIFRGTGYDADGQREIVTDSYHPETADSARWNNGSTAGTYNHISQWGGFAYIQLFKMDSNGNEIPAYPYNHDGSIGQVYVDIEGIVPVTKSGNTYTYGNTMVRNPAEIIKMMFCNPQLTNEGPCAIGFGYSESDVDFSKAIADCESLGFKIDGSFNQTGQFSEALKKILYHCRGYIIEEDSKIKLVVDMPVERVSASFDETGEYGHDCNLETWAEPNLDEQFNRARLSYAWNYKNSKFDKKPDPNHESPDYDSSNPSATSVYDEWLYDDDSYRTLKKWNTTDIELDMVHDTMTAHKLASYYLRKSIYQKIKGTISVDPESAVNLDAGNLIKIRSEQFGWYMTYYDTNGSETVDTEDGKMFQITSVRKGQELTEIDFVEYNSEIFLLDSVGTMTAKTNESEFRKKLAPQKPVSVGVSEKTPIKSNNGTYLCAVDVVVTYQSGTPVSTVIQMGDAGTGDTAPSSSGVTWNDVAMISENRTTITGLTPGHWYYFNVFSINANGSSVPVISNAVHVQGDSTAPEVPTLTIDSITGRSVTVKVVLNNAPDDFAGFTVRRGNTVLEKVPCGRIANESTGGTVTYRAEINYVNVCELYDTDYTFSASAYDMWGNESNPCTAVTAHTEEAIDLTDIESSIEALEDDMTDTNTRITGYASDNVLSIGEKAELAKDWLSIKNDRYQKIKTEAENHGMNLSASSYKTDYDNFVTAYTNLFSWVDGSSSNIALIPTPPATLQESSFANVCSTTAQKFADYQTCEIKLLSDIDKDNKNRSTAIYAECNTPADVASKIVILPDVVIFDGLRLCVKFLNGNSTIQTITLNIKRDESDVSGLIDGGQLYTEKGIAVPSISINAGEMITFVLVERKIIDYSNGTTTTTTIKVWEFADSALLGMGQNGTVQDETYSLGMVNGCHIIAHTVDTQQLKAQSVTTDILKAGSVTTDKLTSEQIIGRDFRTDTDVGIRDSLTGLYNSGVMFDGNGIKGYDQYGQTVSIGTNGTITALRGEIGGWIIGDDSLESTGMRDMDSYDPQTSTPVKTIIIKSNGMIYTSDFVSGMAGWLIDSEGNAEFNNIRARGAIRTAVFETNKISAIGGTLFVRPATVITAHTTTSNNQYTIYVDDNSEFSTGDIARIKYDTVDMWFTVTGTGGTTGGYYIRATLSNGTFTEPEIGCSIVNYGTSGSGGIYLDGNAPKIDLYSHSGTPWNSLKIIGRIGNINGVNGIITTEYGFFFGNSNTSQNDRHYIQYKESTGELELAGKMIIKSGSNIYKTGTTTIDGGIIATDSITANQLVKTSALITNTAQINQAVFQSLIVTNGSTVANQVDVGGRNLALNSDVQKTISGKSYVFYSLSDYGKTNVVNAGKITVSAEVKCTESGRTIDFYLRSSSGATTTIAVADVYPSTTEFTRVKATFNAPTGTTSIDVAVRSYNSSTNTTYVKNVKCEIGNKATTWTPAPEDVDADSTAKANAVKNGLGTNGYTSIHGGNIMTDTITANAIAANSITAEKLSVTTRRPNNCFVLLSARGNKESGDGAVVPDLSGFSNDFKMQNAVTISSSPTASGEDWTFGFTTTNGQRILSKSSVSIPAAFTAWIRVWITTTIGSVGSALFDIGTTTNGNNRFMIYLNPSGYLCVYSRSNSGTATDTATDIKPATGWNDIFVNVTTTSIDLIVCQRGYANVVKKTITVSTRAAFTATVVSVGGNVANTSNFGYYGYIQTFQLYGKNLTEDEIIWLSKNWINTESGQITADRIAAGSIETRHLTANSIVGKTFQTASNTGTSNAAGVRFNSSGIQGFNGTSKTFDLNTNGKLTCSDVDLTGKITATSGKINNLNLNSTLSLQYINGLRETISKSSNCGLAQTSFANDYDVGLYINQPSSKISQGIYIDNQGKRSYSESNPTFIESSAIKIRNRGDFSHGIYITQEDSSYDSICINAFNNYRCFCLIAGNVTKQSDSPFYLINVYGDSTYSIYVTGGKCVSVNGWSGGCDESIKKDIKDVSTLEKLKKIRVKKFKYSQKAIQEKEWEKEHSLKLEENLKKGIKTEEEPMPEFKDDENAPDYIMAMAGEFNKAFGVDNGNEESINYTNAIGVCMRAIQELAAEVDELKAKLKIQQDEQKK